MTTYISMLRGSNVGGQKKIQMEALRSLYTGLGLTNVRSYVQSGNVVFDSDEQAAALLAGRIEAQIEQAFGFAVLVFVRGVPDFQRVLAGNPFLKTNANPARLHVTFLYNPPSETAISSLGIPAASGDQFWFGEQEIYLYCPNATEKPGCRTTFSSGN
ncbi:MAG: DUF1697 domain-containing protein [Chloroflexi bacterium]|nr:DUF1697 domain-containing protein [Chloroflexota bacterium]